MDRATIERILSVIFRIIGLSIILITLLVAGINYVRHEDIDLLRFSILIPLGFALLSIGLAFDADVKTIIIANVLFLQAASDFEYDRAMFVNPVPGQYSLEFFLWRSKNDLERANEFNKKIIKPLHQEKMYNYFCVSLWQILEGSRIAWGLMKTDNKKKILDMCRIAREFNKTPEDEKKVIGLFEKYMGKLKTETEETFLKRLQL